MNHKPINNCTAHCYLQMISPEHSQGLVPAQIDKRRENSNLVVHVGRHSYWAEENSWTSAEQTVNVVNYLIGNIIGFTVTLFNFQIRSLKQVGKVIKDITRDKWRQKKIWLQGSWTSKELAVYWSRLLFLDTIDDERDTFSNANAEAVNDNDIHNDTVEELENEIVD